MAFSKAFERKLNNLFHQRTHWLRAELGSSGAGKPPEFGRKKVAKGIRDLQLIASDALVHKLARTEFEQHVASVKNYHVKGHGPYDKKRRFEAWYKPRFRKAKAVVYAFWGKSKGCIYVGRTGSHGTRPSAHFEKFWFSSVRRVTIFSVKGSSHVPKLECLAIHRYQPSRNRNKAATKKWTKACPLCTTHKYIENELRDIFRFK